MSVEKIDCCWLKRRGDIIMLKDSMQPSSLMVGDGWLK